MSRLWRCDVEATDVAQAGLGAAVASSTVVLLESPAIGPDEFLAVSGSRAAAAVARHAGVPVWLVAGVGRMLPARMWEGLRSRVEPDEPWDADDEIVPLDLVDRIVGPARRRDRWPRRSSASTARSPPSSSRATSFERIGFGPCLRRRDLIRMTDDEVEAFLHERQTMNIASFGPDGNIHLVAMWYGFLGPNPAFETFTKSQKVLNLRRDPRITVLVEDGDVYEELRGVEIVGQAIVHDDREPLHGRRRQRGRAVLPDREPRRHPGHRRGAGHQAGVHRDRAREGRQLGPPQARPAATDRRHG